MHLTLIFIVIVISFSTAYPHPLFKQPQPHQQQKQLSEVDSSTSRPLQQFFQKILSAFRGKSSTTRAPASTTQRISAPYHEQQQIEVQQIPNFVDYSTYLLNSFTTNNSAIKFSYIQPNVTTLRAGNYSVISFLLPHDINLPSNGPFKALLNFLNAFRSNPSDTVYSQFPPIFEYFTQRVQAYFSIYKYTDDSRLNNTIVVEVPENNVIQSDDFIATTTDDYYQMETTEVESNELSTTTEISNEM